MICPAPPELIACWTVSAARSASSRAFELRLHGGVGELGDRDLGVEPGLEIGDGALDLGLPGVEVRELGVELVGDVLLLLFLTFEVGLLALELRVHRRQLLHDVVVGLVRLVEQLLATGGVDGALGVDQRLQRVPGVGVGEQRPLPGVGTQLFGARLGGGDRALQVGDVRAGLLELVVRLRERRRGVVGRLARVGERLACGLEVVARRGARWESRHAHARGGKNQEEESTEDQRHTAGIACPGIGER